ncbi:MAG: arylsulfatase [Phycisphaerae bacterium]|nr:arylsulfatase [Phycisphaerae bacterium]
MLKRREFLRQAVATGATAALAPFASPARAAAEKKLTAKPNIILVLTDDQGYGDVGFNGNKVIKTPNLDKFARENVVFDRFYVDPVCTPTRAALMTGRQPYRLHITWVGQALPVDEVTIAQVLKQGGYATACYGKWGNLGSYYPRRAIDKGFDEAVVHLKGQFSPPQNKTAYFDPILWKNGKEIQFKGYCNDIWFDQAEKFIEKNRTRPFFIYLPTNLPHLPAQVPQEYSKPYEGKLVHDQAERAAGMITHIDRRFGRMMKKLDKLGLIDNTIVIFLSDNGPVWTRDQIHLAGLRGKKGWVYEGGIRVPCVMSWPVKWKGARRLTDIAAHIDIMPTLLDAAGVEPKKNIAFDGISLTGLLERGASVGDRTLIIQGYPHSKPQKNRCFMVTNRRYKLVQPIGYRKPDNKMYSPKPMDESLFRYELYDIAKDPGERNDIAAQNPEVVARMRKQYDRWYEDVTKNPGLSRPAPLIHVGHARQRSVRIMMYGGKTVEIVHPGPYRITLEPYGIVKWKRGDVWDGEPFVARDKGLASFKIGDISMNKPVNEGDKVCVFERVVLSKGKANIRPSFVVGGKTVIGGRNAENKQQGPIHVTFERLD